MRKLYDEIVPNEEISSSTTQGLLNKLSSSLFLVVDGLCRNGIELQLQQSLLYLKHMYLSEAAPC